MKKLDTSLDNLTPDGIKKSRMEKAGKVTDYKYNENI